MIPAESSSHGMKFNALLVRSVFVHSEKVWRCKRSGQRTGHPWKIARSSALVADRVQGRTYIYIHLHFLNVYIYDIYTYTHVYVYIYIDTCVCSNVYVYIYIHTMYLCM